MFFSQLSSLARWVPSAVSPLITNRGRPCHLAARRPHTTVSWDPGLCVGQVSPGLVSGAGPRRPGVGVPPSHCSEGGTAHLLGKEMRDKGDDNDNV